MRLSVGACFACLTATLILGSVVLAQQAEKLAQGYATSAQVVVTNLASDGIDLISPNGADFDPTIQHLLPSDLARTTLGLKPFLVILSNRSGHTIVAFETIWKVTYKDRSPETSFAPILYLDAVGGTEGKGDDSLVFTGPEDLPILNGEQRLVARETAFGPPNQKFTQNEELDLQNWLRASTQNRKAKMADAVEVQINLDAAIYSDGLLVGPDTSNLDQNFTAKLHEKQRLFRQIVSDLDAGHTEEEAFGPAKALAIQRPIPSRNPLSIYEAIAAQEIVALRRRVGDSAVPATVRQAIRKDPFVIRRTPTQK